MANSEYNLTVVDGTALTISLSGPVGPAGAGGGISTISTSTPTALIGYIYGNGTTIAGATTATSANTVNTLVKRDEYGIADFSSLRIANDDSGLVPISCSGGVFSFGYAVQIDPATKMLQLSGGGIFQYTFPNADGKVPVYTVAPTAGQVLTSSGTNGAATWVTATSANTANTLVKRDATGGTSFFGDVTVNGDQSTSPRLFLGNVQTGAGELETSGQLVFKGNILGTTDTIIQGNDGAMFVSSPINGATYINSSPIGASSSLAFSAVTGDTFYEFPNANGTVALTNPSTGTQTFTGTQIFTTRPTSSGSGTLIPTSLITAADGDTRYGRDFIQIISTAVEAFSTAFVNGPDLVLPAGTYDFEILALIESASETAGGQSNFRCSPSTDVTTGIETRFVNVAALGTGGTAGTSFRKGSNQLGSPDFFAACYFDAPNNFASVTTRGATVLVSETTVSFRIRQRSATDAVNATKIAVGSFIKFTKR
jgi:hypothetical protein